MDHTYVDSFKKLKELLTSAPVLTIVDTDKDFVLYTNACKEGVSGLSMREGQDVCYESKKLSVHEENYMTHDLELVAIFHSLKMWRHYLFGWNFKLMTYYSGLKYLF